MNERKLQGETCRQCGSKTREYTVRNQHCCGEWNESRVYACGFALEYSPNCGEVRVKNQCSNSEEYKEARTKRRNAFQTVLKVVNTLDVDEEYKNRLLKAVQYEEGHIV